MWNARLLGLVTLYQLATVLVLSAATFWLWRAGALAVFLGGGFGALNFWGLRLLAERTFDGGKPKVLYAVLLAFKMVLALAVMAGLLIILKLHPLAFGVGLSALFFGVTFAMAHVRATQKPQGT